MELRPYQIDLVNAVRQSYIEGCRRPCIVLGCGGGKSVIVAEIARQTTAKGNRVLFLVHRRELCEQIERTFLAAGVNMALCDVMMVQTATKRLCKLRAPTLIITDENHHCLASSYRRIYDFFPDARCIGVTATPIRLNGAGLGDVNDKLIIGVSTKYLIEHSYLAPYDYYAPQLVDAGKLHTKNGEYMLSGLTLEPAIYGDVIRYYRKLADGKQAICYCSTLSHSREMTSRFLDAGIPAAHIDGTTPAAERAATVEQFRNGTVQILCNVDLISEGFDVPDCTAAILLRPTKSLTLYIQQSMRCMRYKSGKRAIIIDHVGNCNRFGLPDDDRVWDLNAKPQRKKADEIKIKPCPHCFRVYDSALKVCPFCKWDPRIYDEDHSGGGRQRPAEIRDAALQKVSRVVMDYRGPEDCHTISELQAYAKNMHYKPGWVYYQAKARGMIT